MEFPKHLVELAEEAFEAYLTRGPEAQTKYDELVVAVNNYVKDNRITTPVEQVIDELCTSIM